MKRDTSWPGMLYTNSDDIWIHRVIVLAQLTANLAVKIAIGLSVAFIYSSGRNKLWGKDIHNRNAKIQSHLTYVLDWLTLKRSNISKTYIPDSVPTMQGVLIVELSVFWWTWTSKESASTTRITRQGDIPTELQKTMYLIVYEENL